MHVRQAMYRLGGVAERAALLEQVPRGRLAAALRSGEVVRVSRGRYALPVVEEGLRAAAALSGVASHLSAALLWGWEVKALPVRPAVTVPRNRKVSPERQRRYAVHWASLRVDDVDGGRTSRDRTFLDCARSLPFDEALAVADSALRHGMTKEHLTALAESVRGPGRGRCRRVAHAADERAANPLESTLRAIALEVPGLRLAPQVELRGEHFLARPDLVDVRRRLVVEAEGFEWHGNRKALARDCRRYTALTVHGWAVVRFSWEDVMLDPAYVRATLTALASRGGS